MVDLLESEGVAPQECRADWQEWVAAVPQVFAVPDCLLEKLGLAVEVLLVCAADCFLPEQLGLAVAVLRVFAVPDCLLEKLGLAVEVLLVCAADCFLLEKLGLAVEVLLACAADCFLPQKPVLAADAVLVCAAGGLFVMQGRLVQPPQACWGGG